MQGAQKKNLQDFKCNFEMMVLYIKWDFVNEV